MKDVFYLSLAQNPKLIKNYLFLGKFNCALGGIIMIYSSLPYLHNHLISGEPWRYKHEYYLALFFIGAMLIAIGTAVWSTGSAASLIRKLKEQN